jgi:DNA-binding MarR family transcriptional regulator
MASIEEEIKQEKKFATEHEKAAVNVMFTGSWLHNNNSTWLKKHGITPEQFNVLRILRGSYPKPLMLGSVTCRMIDKNSNATRLVEKLRIKGLVKREQCPSNRRQVDIVITDKGLSLLTKLDNESSVWLDNLKGITKAEAAELNRLLDKLRS